MRSVLSMVLAAGLLCGAGATIGFADDQHDEAAGQARTVQGELIDTQCYAAGEASGAAHADCATKCLSSGIPAGLLMTDGSVLIITTNPAPLAEHAGKQMRATGNVNAKTQTVSPDKLEVQGDDGQWQEVQMSDAHHGGGDEG